MTIFKVTFSFFNTLILNSIIILVKNKSRSLIKNPLLTIAEWIFILREYLLWIIIFVMTVWLFMFLYEK